MRVNAKSVFPKDTTIHCSSQKPIVTNLTIANLRSYQLSCTAASWDDSIKCLSQRHNRAFLGRPLYIKEFSDVGIVDAQQIVDINGNFKSYDEIATEYDLIPNNRSFIEYIKLISVVPHRWQLNSVFDNQRNEFIENVLQNLQTYGKSTKSFYDYFFSKIESLPKKQQTRWNEELNLSISTDD